MRISVIICAYNESAWLGRCLKSLETQNYQDFEVIIVNDHSHDETAAVIEAWRRHSPLKIRPITNSRNVGLGASRNIAIDQAKNEYLFFCDGDDYLLDNRYFSEIADVLEKENPDIVVTPYVREKWGSLSYDVFTEKKQLSTQEAGQDYLSREFGTHGACAKFFRKNCFDQFRFSEHGFSEDVKCLFPVFLNAGKVLALRRYGYVYAFNPLSITQKKVLGIADLYSSLRLMLEVLTAAIELQKTGIEIDTSAYMETWKLAHAPIITQVAETELGLTNFDLLRPIRTILNEFCPAEAVTAFIDRQKTLNEHNPALPDNAIAYFQDKLKVIDTLQVQKNKVVIYTPSLGSGGLQKIAADISIALSDLGYEVILLLEKPEEVSYPHKGQIHLASFKSAAALWHLHTCEIFIDCVYEEDVKNYPVIKYVLEKFPEKFVATLHTTVNVDKYFKSAERQIAASKLKCEDLRGLICVSEPVREYFRDYYECDPANLHVLPNSIDLEHIKAAPVHKASHPYILFSGRLRAVEHKGLDLLLDAYWRTGLYKSFHLYLMGDGELPNEIKSFIEEKKLSRHVHLPGFSDEIYSYMKGAAFVFHPSRWEGFGLVNVEALACGTPVLTSIEGNAAGAVRHKENGYLFNWHSEADIDKGIKCMVKNYNKMRANCAKGVERFSFNAYRERLGQILRKKKKK